MDDDMFHKIFYCILLVEYKRWMMIWAGACSRREDPTVLNLKKTFLKRYKDGVSFLCMELLCHPNNYFSYIKSSEQEHNLPNKICKNGSVSQYDQIWPSISPVFKMWQWIIIP
jgi:hypothetical protein